MIQSTAKAILLASILIAASSTALAQPPRVIYVRVEANPVDFTGPCPTTITFTGKIRMDGPGEVKYIWRRSDGGRSRMATLNFPAAGELEVTTTWTLGGARFPDRARWESIRILFPNSADSSRASFRVHCESP
jgi:hypothetical protein